MKTPEAKYDNDPYYRRMVDFIVREIIEYNYTPSEMREIAIFASTHAERMRSHPIYVYGHKFNLNDE